MKFDSLSTLSLNDISVSLSDAEKDDNGEKDSKGSEEEGGTSETLCQLRKRSRKRRSFIETDFTSRVSYPEPERRQDLVLSRFHNNILADPSDVHLLSSDPEPSEQTKNPSPTVSLLTHSEGEPAQLESKPILSTSPSDAGSPEQPRDGQHPTGNRRPEMEMEPDAMESKSVTDVLKAASPTITVVRCRVDPDGKECSDWQGDGKEETGSQDQSDEENQEEETTGLVRNASFTSHRLLAKISEEKEKDGPEEAEELGSPCSTTNPESNNLATCLMDINTKSSNGLPGAHFIGPHPNAESLMLKSLLSYSPPPPPPSSPLPPTPQRNDCPVEPQLRESKLTSNQIPLSDLEHEPPCQQNHSGQLHLHFGVGKRENDEEAVSVVSDEVTDSINSDNVFEDDEVSISLNSASSDKKYDWSSAARRSISASFAALGKGESQGKHHHTSMETHKRLHSLNNDYTFAIRSITEKLGAATSATSPTFNSGAEVRSDFANESDHNLNQMGDNPSRNSSFAETCNSLSPIFNKATADGIHNLSKCPPPSPTHFLFQTCSPSLMGRLSASTLRGKIQNLPLYLSRSQESLHIAGEENTTEGPVADNAKDNVEITVTDVNDVTQTVGFETDTTAESDDSDATVTGSEVDGEFYIEEEPGKRCCTTLEEINELSSSAPPVQTEPRAQHHDKLPDSGLSTASTPGPIREPPTSILNSLQKDSPRPKTDTPGPTKQSSPSVPTGIVVTTQNLNGPGLQFQNQSQAVRRTSRDRPLIGLCGPTEPHLDPPNKSNSLGWRVFTVCEESPQTQVTAELQPVPALKPELGCSSAMVSGCETVAEGLQVPLDACGCPPVYTNCFSGSDSFDEELTVYEFSCRSQGSSITQTSSAVPLVTTPPLPSFLSVSSSHSPFLPSPNFFSSSTSELSPLLSPLSDTSHCFPSPTDKDIVSRLGQQCYPEPPAGFQVLRVDVDQLLSVLEGGSGSAEGHGGRHPRDTCPAHFTENKRVLQTEAKRLTSNCQKVVGTVQSPEEMLCSLAESFRTLVGLAVVCLWFSGCDRCDRRNAEAVAGLADVARSFRDFCLAAERVSSKRSCQDLSTKLLAKQCTALTASVFCLTQIFRTLTAL